MKLFNLIKYYHILLITLLSHSIIVLFQKSVTNTIFVLLIILDSFVTRIYSLYLLNLVLKNVQLLKTFKLKERHVQPLISR